MYFSTVELQQNNDYGVNLLFNFKLRVFTSKTGSELQPYHVLKIWEPWTSLKLKYSTLDLVIVIQ